METALRPCVERATLVDMTNVPEKRTPETDEALRLIGVIAVESARLHWFLAGLLSTLDPTRNHMQCFKVPHDLVAENIRALLIEHPSWMGSASTEGLARYAAVASALVEQAAGGRAGLLGAHDLEELVADRHQRVHETERRDAGVAEADLEAELRAQRVDRRFELAGHEGDLT